MAVIICILASDPYESTKESPMLVAGSQERGNNGLQGCQRRLLRRIEPERDDSGGQFEVLWRDAHFGRGR
jgi:hypothetical protein